MGEIIRFPGEVEQPRGRSASVGELAEPATVIILPVIRIEREPDGEETGRRKNSGRRRRRPA